MKILFPELDTPSLLIEKKILEKNINDMQSLMNKFNVRLRPHIKSHKSLLLAKMQLDAGAVGIACAKVTEALVFAEAGFEDIQIANIIIGEHKFQNLLKLMDFTKKLSVCVDSIENASQLSFFLKNINRIIDVLIIVDCGYGRDGIEKPDEILKLAKFIDENKSLNLLGITTHAGHAYASCNNEEREIIAKHEGEFMVSMAGFLMENGINIDSIIIGSNPTARICCKIPGVTEIRTGNYIFNDMIQVTLGTVVIENCALTLLTQVISMPSNDRVIFDAGSKSLSSDKGAHGNENLIGYGKIINKNAIIEKLSEEHSIVKHNGEKFHIGERVRIIPNHACTAVNMFDKAFIVDGDKIIDEIEIQARGKLN